MISFHPASGLGPQGYGRGFVAADTDEPQRVAACASKFVWSGICWNGGQRKEANFAHSDWMVLDFESADYQLAQAVKDFCDRRHVIGTTNSHQLQKGRTPPIDRFRVAVPWDRRITSLRLYRYNMHRVGQFYDLDKACVDGARFFWPCKEIVSLATDGEPWEIDTAIPDNFEKPYSVEYWKVRQRAGLVPAWLRAKIRNGAGDGARNITLFQVASDLAKLGWMPDKIEAVLAAQPWVADLSPGEIRRTIRSGYRRGAAHVGIAPVHRLADYQQPRAVAPAPQPAGTE